MLHHMYGLAKPAIAIIAAFCTGGVYLATETVVSESTLIPLASAVVAAVFIASMAFKWGGRIARLEDRISVLEGRKSDEWKPGMPPFTKGK